MDQTNIEQDLLPVKVPSKELAVAVPTPKEIEVAIAALDKQFGAGSVIRLGSEDIQAWPSISTGASNLDLALGIGGLPRGRIVEIFGPESSGKSTLCLSVIAEAQAQGDYCAFIDVEHAIDPGYASALGVDLDSLYFSQPSYGEEALEILDSLIGTGKISVIIVDSVAALVPKAELEGGMEDNHMGLQARMMGQMLRKVTAKAAENKCLVIFTNQLRQKIGIMFGNPETTPGGLALKFYSSVRIDLRKKEDIKNTETGEITGVRTKAKIIKNKMAPPLKMVEFDIVYGKGINSIGVILDMAADRGIINKSGAWFSYKDEQLGQGRVKTIQALASDMELFKEIKDQVLKDG